MNLRYVLSDTNDYARQIAEDGGPAFAAAYEWPTMQFRELEADDRPSINIIDLWIDDDESVRLQKMVETRDDSIFVLHAVDPWPHITGQAIFKLARQICERRNFVISSTYPTAENWSSIWSRAPYWGPILTPYLYDKSKELPCSHEGRSNKILLSGNIGANDYPVRANAELHRRLNPMFWGRIKRLKHPGYIAAEVIRKGGYYGDGFVKYLARYKFAFVCSSRLRLEFLKYREIAYAGSVPVGDLPGTLQDCPRDAYVHWRRNFIRTWRDLPKIDTEASARQFRHFMAEARDPQRWRMRVLNQLDMIYAAYRRSQTRPLAHAQASSTVGESAI